MWRISVLCPSEKECPFWRISPKAPDLTQARGLKSQRNSPVGRDLKIILRHLRRQPLINHASPHPSRTHLLLYAYALNQLPGPPLATASNPTSQWYGAHDRAHQDDREWVEGISREVERLESLGDVGVAEAAGVIQGDHVHVLIDLMGHTRGNRREILAWQVSAMHITVQAGSCQNLPFFCLSHGIQNLAPAYSILRLEWQPCPVQVSYKGYMSTSGASSHVLSLVSDGIRLRALGRLHSAVKRCATLSLAPCLCLRFWRPDM